MRTGARRLIEAAVTAEFEEYLSAFVQEQLPDGRQRVVRNGHLPERKILTGLGEVGVRVPKARSRSGSPEPFRSSVVPPYVRRCASLDAAIPWLYLALKDPDADPRPERVRDRQREEAHPIGRGYRKSVHGNRPGAEIPPPPGRDPPCAAMFADSSGAGAYRANEVRIAAHRYMRDDGGDRPVCEGGSGKLLRRSNGAK